MLKLSFTKCLENSSCRTSQWTVKEKNNPVRYKRNNNKQQKKTRYTRLTDNNVFLDKIITVYMVKDDKKKKNTREENGIRTQERFLKARNF